jgi:hypothetical protein
MCLVDHYRERINVLKVEYNSKQELLAHHKRAPSTRTYELIRQLEDELELI